VEVLSSSDAYDRTLKLPLYARTGVREVWLVDIERGVVETYRHPSQRGYRARQEYRRGQGIALTAPIRAAVRVNEVLG
jgi:Uma2 family endonuclease